MEEQDPRLSPEADDGQELSTGQGEESVSASEAAPNAEQLLRERLEALEKANKEAQRKITKQGQELSQYRQQRPGNGSDDGEGVDLWTNPDVYLDRKLAPVVGFIQRQEARENLVRMAKERGVDAEQLQSEFERLQNASNDPDALADLMTDIVRSRNTSSQIEQAKREAQASAEKKARATTAESGGSHVEPPGKALEDMSVSEMREYLAAKYGTVPSE